MKYRIVRVTEWKNVYYKIQSKWLFMWTDETDYVTYQSLQDAEYVIKYITDKKNVKEEIVRNY